MRTALNVDDAYLLVMGEQSMAKLMMAVKEETCVAFQRLPPTASLSCLSTCLFLFCKYMYIARDWMLPRASKF